MNPLRAPVSLLLHPRAGASRLQNTANPPDSSPEPSDDDKEDKEDEENRDRDIKIPDRRYTVPITVTLRKVQDTGHRIRKAPKERTWTKEYFQIEYLEQYYIQD